MRSFDTFADFENGLLSLKATLQDREETEKQATFHGSAKIVASGSGRFRYALECNDSNDYLLFGSWVKAKSVEFWVNLGTTAETIIDPVSGTDIAVSSGALTYGDWDKAYVDSVETDAIATDWHHVVITSSTDVTLAGGFNLGKGNLKIAQMRWWNCELSSMEIGQLYNGTVGNYNQNCVLCLDLPNLTDLSGNGNDGTNHGATVVASGRNSGSALSFDGVDDYVDCGFDDSLNITDAITIGVWIKWDNSIDGRLVQRIAATSGYALVGRNSDDVVFYIHGATDQTYLISTGSLITGNWYYVVATFSDEDNLQTIYINGENNSQQGITHELAPSAAFLSIGANSYWSGNCFNGSIDEVRIYDRALSAIEVHMSYVRGRRGLL